MCSVSQLRPILVTPWTVPARLFCPWGSPGKKTGVGCHFLLQEIFLTQGSNLQMIYYITLNLENYNRSKELDLWKHTNPSSNHSPATYFLWDQEYSNDNKAEKILFIKWPTQYNAIYFFFCRCTSEVLQVWFQTTSIKQLSENEAPIFWYLSAYSSYIYTRL